MNSARNDLTQLPSFEGLNCGNGTSIMLERQSFDDQYVRWLGVMRDGKIICRGARLGVNHSASRVLRIDDVWSFLLIQPPGKTLSLMLVQKRGDLQYLAAFEHLLFDSLTTACQACVSYSIALGDRSDIEMKYGTMTAPAAVSYSVEQVQPYGRFQLTLFATQQYVDRFRFYGWLYAAVLGTLVAASVALMIYGFLVRRASFAFLVKQGLKRREFLPFYQPIVDCRDGTVLGAEALVRWRTYGGNFVQPGQFIPMAEESGLITELPTNCSSRCSSI